MLPGEILTESGYLQYNVWVEESIRASVTACPLCDINSRSWETALCWMGKGKCSIYGFVCRYWIALGRLARKCWKLGHSSCRCSCVSNALQKDAKRTLTISGARLLCVNGSYLISPCDISSNDFEVSWGKFRSKQLIKSWSKGTSVTPLRCSICLWTWWLHARLNHVRISLGVSDVRLMTMLLGGCSLHQ